MVDRGDVCKALAHDGRRKLLDLLYDEDGQTLTELCEYFDISRIAVMKHLDRLEDVGLVTTEKVGRERHHFLHSEPLDRLYDSWIRKYTEVGIAGAPPRPAGEDGDRESNARYIYPIMIQSDPETIWRALTDPEVTFQYLFKSSIESSWEEGAEWELQNPAGFTPTRGRVLEVDPPHRLAYTWQLNRPQTRDEAPSRVRWLIDPEAGPDGVSVLVLIHDWLEGAPETARRIRQDWPEILSGMKTLLETGRPMGSDE